MKKTMFITSVIMVVVMAIALTTSSLAWFSASGAATVTTNTLQLTAKSTASTGISISNDGVNNWGPSIDLNKRATELAVNGNAQDLMPLVPFTKSGSAATTTELITALLGGTEQPYLTMADFNDNKALYPEYDATNTTANPTELAQAQAAAALEARIAEQAIGTVGSEDVDRPAYMIGAEVGLNDLFNANVDRSGFMYDTFYIKNDATGASAANIVLSATVNFTIDVERTPDAQHDANWIETIAYTEENRGEARYASDATLCVVVLVAKEQFETTANINDAIETEAANPYAYAGSDATNPASWEILVFAKSKLGADDDLTNETVASRAYNITLGKQASDFDSGSPIANCTKTLNLYDYMNGKVESYDYLRPQREYDGKTIEADKKLVKVIAWYDGVGLNNNNSSMTNLQFDLRFDSVTAGAWSASSNDIHGAPVNP